MFSHQITQLSRDILGLPGQTTHTTEQTMFTDSAPQTIAFVFHFGVGFIEQQEVGYGLAALFQLAQSPFGLLACPLRHSFDVSHRHPSGIDKSNQHLDQPHRQPQLEAAQGDQPIDLLPPRLPGFRLARPFRRNQLPPAPLATPALDQDLDQALPPHGQHQDPIQHPIGPILLGLSATARTGEGLFLFVRFYQSLCRVVRPGWELIDQHCWQGFVQLLQIVAQRTLRYFGLSGCCGYIDLLERFSNRFDFFVYRTYSISYGQAYLRVKLALLTLSISTTGSPFFQSSIHKYLVYDTTYGTIPQLNRNGSRKPQAGG